MRHPHAASRSFRIASNLAFFAAKASIDVILAKLARGSREAEYDATPALSARTRPMGAKNASGGV
jgi:hypothetical protein